MNYAYQLHKQLTQHKEQGCINISQKIDSLIKLSRIAIEQYNDVESDKNDMASEMVTLQFKMEDAEAELSEKNASTEQYGLLGQQIKEAFVECMNNTKINQIQFLEVLEEIAKWGISSKALKQVEY